MVRRWCTNFNKSTFDGGLLHGDCMTVTGKTIKENLKNIVNLTNQKVIYRKYNNPLSEDGGFVGLKGNLSTRWSNSKSSRVKKKI